MQIQGRVNAKPGDLIVVPYGNRLWFGIFIQYTDNSIQFARLHYYGWWRCYVNSSYHRIAVIQKSNLTPAEYRLYRKYLPQVLEVCKAIKLKQEHAKYRKKRRS